MPIIEEFPKDDAYRLVKWVDKFTLPHLTTRSTSVTVRLQRVPFQRHSDLNRLTRESAVALLPLDRTDAGQAQYTSVAVHAGLLPHLAIGRVYQGQRLVGELPTRQATLTLVDAELSCHEIKIGEELPAPAGWTYPYKQLLSREFGGIQTEFGASRCLVFVDASGIEYVIPRALIFQRFYAIQRELANAFTSGPWAQTRHRIVYEGQLKSGLETRIDPATGAWHVILQTHVDNDFARLAALLYFDDYAAAQAESIYTGMLSDRRANVHSPWFASAQIPFRAEAKPLRLHQGFHAVPPRLGRREGGGKPVVHKQSFLVTSILGSSWPSYTPLIKAGRLNSGDKGKEQLPAQGAGLMQTTSALGPQAANWSRPARPTPRLHRAMPSPWKIPSRGWTMKSLGSSPRIVASCTATATFILCHRRPMRRPVVSAHTKVAMLPRRITRYSSAILSIASAIYSMRSSCCTVRATCSAIPSSNPQFLRSWLNVVA